MATKKSDEAPPSGDELTELNRRAAEEGAKATEKKPTKSSKE